MIRTVLGDISPEKIIHAQCHEHLFVEMGKSYEVSPVLYMEDEQKAETELTEYKKAGGSLVVDAQPFGFGRMAEKLYRVSEKTGVDIIASTGFHKLVFCDIPNWFSGKSAEELGEFFSSELLQGMHSSIKDGKKKLPCKAGMIKTAVDKGGVFENELYTKLFKAAAIAQKKTGAPVLCHIEQNADAIEVIDFLEEQGVLASKIIICHLDRARYDFAYHEKVAARGVYFDYDSVNRLKYLSHEQETALIYHMVKCGFEDRIMLSLDTTNARIRACGADMGLDYIITQYKEMILKAGITQKQYDMFMTENPKKALLMGD